MSRLLIAFAMGLHIGFFSGCTPEKSPVDPITIEEAVGMSVGNVEETWGKTLVPVDGSFSILVSKNLHPNQPPADHKLYRLGETGYTILEFNPDNKLVAIHHVKG